MSTNKQKLIQRFETLKFDIEQSTTVNKFEGAKDKAARIENLKKRYSDFAEYYFPMYCMAPTAWFHKKIFMFILKNPNMVFLLQWSREFAKSVHANIIFPFFLWANGELDGMIVGCANEDDAEAKLSDLQAEFESNQRIINDYGEQKLYGSWETGNFSLKNGTFFRAFGRKQSPRGVRRKQKRPNYGVLDDIDDKQLVKNDKLSKENYDWVKEEFMAALSIKKWWLVVAENKFHKNTITAQFEKDKDSKKRIYLSRVNLLNDKRESNWPENYTTQECLDKIDSIGEISAQREYFNTPVEEGTVFKQEWIKYSKMLPFEKYDYIISYTDPSYKNTDKSDFKATVLIGKKGIKYHVIKAYVDRAEISMMFTWMYDIHELINDRQVVRHWMEDAFLQDLMWKELDAMGADKGFVLPVGADKRSKPDKFMRIEAMQPLFQRGIIEFNEDEQNDPGMVKLISQFLAFERGSRINDDGPDAIEGAIYILNERSRDGKPPTVGRRPISRHKY